MVWWVLVALVATLLLIVTRPRGLPEPWSAAAGAVAMVLLGVVRPGDVAAIVTETANVLLFLLGIMVLTALVEGAGVFERIAERVAVVARGSGLRLFGLVFLLAAVVTGLLSLDVTVLVLTPIVYAVATRRRLDALPFMFACTFVANTGSLALPVSNLTNLLVFDRLELGFADFAARMWLPNLVAVAVNFAVFVLVFRHRLPRRFDATAETMPANDWWGTTAFAVLGATLIAIFGLGLAHLPLAWASVAGGTLLLLIGLAGRRVRWKDAATAVAWPLFVYVVGMFVVVRGFEAVWLDRTDLRLPADPVTALLLAVGGTAVGSNIVNNVPMTLLWLPFLERANEPIRDVLAYGVLVGANIGPTLTTYGSLATMIWLSLVRRRGVDLSTAEYLKVALVTTPPVLVATTIVLWLVLR